MINQEVAKIFSQMAEVLEYFGDPADRFRIRAYENAALAIKDAPDSLEKLAKEKRLKEIPGIGEGIAKKIEEYVAIGKIREFEMLKKTTPKGLFELLDIPFLGPKKVKVLNRELGIANVEDLKKEIEGGRVQTLPGFGDKSAEKILQGIEIKAANKGRMLIGKVYLLVNSIITELKKCKDVIDIVPAGSFRRCEETVGDIDILATGKNAGKIMEFFKGLEFVDKILAEGETKTSILTHEGLQIDLRVVAPNEFGSALQYFTGSKLHNIHLRTFAKNRGYKISEYGFYKVRPSGAPMGSQASFGLKGEKLIASKTEKQCYASLGMQYIPPEMRTDTGEIEAAFKHEIPKLIEVGDLRGDLHVHSNWSDGVDSIQNMALTAHKREYEYIAITDHSPHIPIVNGLNIDRLHEKKCEIEKMNDILPIKILFGAEVDILADGELDYPDDVLKMFDIVVASIHSRFEHDNTERILKAMENPYVHIIGHISGRMIGRRNPYPLSYAKIFAQAEETGTILEINSQYLRLDLQDIYMREAKKFGCKFAINSDAHSADTLWFTELGVGWARRGWLTKEDVVNTYSLAKLKKALK